MRNLSSLTARIATVLVVGLIFDSAEVGQYKRAPDQGWRRTQEEAIRESAFLYLFKVGTGPDPDYSVYCLSVDSNDPRHPSDPSDSLMKRLAWSSSRKLRRASECEIASQVGEPASGDSLFGLVKDKESGSRAWLISVGRITWVNDHKAKFEGERYCGGLCAWGTTFQASLRKGNWEVTIPPGTSIWVS